MNREFPAPSDNVKRLIAYLKEKPTGAARPARELAREFGLEPLFVAQVLRGLRSDHRFDLLARIQKPSQAAWNLAKGIGEWLKVHTRNVVLVTLYLAFGVFLFQVVHIRGSHVFFSGPALDGSASLLFEAILLHCLLFFLSGDLKAVLTGTANLAVVVTIALAIRLTGQIQAAEQNLRISSIIFTVGGLTASYGVLGGVAAGLGALWQFHKQDELEAQYSRQQLLERLFDLETKLASAEHTEFQPGQLFPGRMTRLFQKYPWRAPFAFGLAYGVAHLIIGAPQVPPDATSTNLRFGVFLLSAAVSVTVGYVADRWASALVRGLMVYLVAFMVCLLNINGYGWQLFFEKQDPLIMVVIIGITAALASLGFLAHMIEEQVNIRTRLEACDPAALLAEIVRIEWKLSAKSQEVVLVSVDAAKSAEMKTTCDPLTAEYSFREYQDFLRLICTSNGGFVHSTAGDGAILAFPNCDKAFHAAREIQTGISYFNEHVNRMKAKFRLRIGIHMGETADDVREVQYTEVIDIAAHVQEVAPIRGIVVTKPVASHLVNEHLIPLREPVDGFEVFLAYNPTVEM